MLDKSIETAWFYSTAGEDGVVAFRPQHGATYTC